MTELPDTLERILSRDRNMVAVSLALVTVLAWAYLIFLALDLAKGEMGLMGMDMPKDGGSVPVGAMAHAVMMSPQPWTAVTFALMGLMWWVMMIGMMVPSAAPMILLFARVQRRKLAFEAPGRRIALFVLGYLLVWLGFSIAATVLQWGMGTLAVLSPMMESTSPALSVVILLLAGIYQLTPLKRACLDHCRNPVEFLSRHWRRGDGGALTLGLRHGAYCVGCCWVLMLLLFAAGVMNLLWVAVIAAFVLVEKVLPAGRWISRAGAFTLFAFAAVLAVQSSMMP
jgi:predicted metal-binding membrane protein